MDAVGEAGGGLCFGVLRPRIVTYRRRKDRSAAIERAGGVELSTIAFTFAGWAIAYSSTSIHHRLADQAHVGNLQVFDQGCEVGGESADRAAVDRADGAKPRWAKLTQV